MDGLQDEAKQVDEGAAQQTQGASAQVSGEGATVGGAGGEKAAAAADGGVARARADYEAALRERDERIAALEGEIAEAAKTAESAEMDECAVAATRSASDSSSSSQVRATSRRRGHCPPDYENDMDKLRAAEPWLFGAGAAAPAQAGATGLPNASAATDEGAQTRRWQKIADIDDVEE